jgi:hypothetical protein
VFVSSSALLAVLVGILVDDDDDMMLMKEDYNSIMISCCAFLGIQYYSSFVGSERGSESRRRGLL